MNIGKKECSEQDEEQEERVFMHVEAEKLMCPFGGDCITYLCPFDGDCIAYLCPFGEDGSGYLCRVRRWFDPKIKNEG